MMAVCFIPAELKWKTQLRPKKIFFFFFLGGGEMSLVPEGLIHGLLMVLQK